MKGRLEAGPKPSLLVRGDPRRRSRRSPCRKRFLYTIRIRKGALQTFSHPDDDRPRRGSRFSSNPARHRNQTRLTSSRNLSPPELHTAERILSEVMSKWRACKGASEGFGNSWSQPRRRRLLCEGAASEPCWGDVYDQTAEYEV